MEEKTLAEIARDMVKALDEASPAAVVTAKQVLQEIADDMSKPATMRAIARNLKSALKKVH